MDPTHKELLRRHRLFLSDQLLVSDTVVPFLYQEEVLTRAQVDDIESEPTDRKKVLKLLDILPGRGPRAFGCFLRALDDFSWVREKLQQGVEPGTASTDAWRLPDELQLRFPSDRELSRLAGVLGAEWEAVLLDLGISGAALYRCRSDHPLSAHGAALAALLLWRQREGRRASAQQLALSLQAAGLHPAILMDVLR